MTAIVDVLKADPIKFLKVFPIAIATSKQSRVADTVHYGQKTITLQGTTKSMKVLRFDTAFANVDNAAAAEVCRAHIVQAEHGAPNFYTLTDQSSLMLTTELSGCCMVLDKSVSPPRIAHVWPHTTACQCGKSGFTHESGAEVQQRLARDYPGCKLYGAENYLQPKAYVLGVRQGNTWRFYTQERPGGGEIAKNGAKEILT
jgi:hypothetical protein